MTNIFRAQTLFFSATSGRIKHPLKRSPYSTVVDLQNVIHSSRVQDTFLRKRHEALIPLSTGKILPPPTIKIGKQPHPIYESTCNRESLILFLLLKSNPALGNLKIVGRVEENAFDQRQIVHVFLKYNDTIIDPTYRSLLLAHPVDLGPLRSSIGDLLYRRERKDLISKLSQFNHNIFLKPWCFIGTKSELVQTVKRRQDALQDLLQPYRAHRGRALTHLLGPYRYLDAQLHLPGSLSYIWENNMDYTDDCNHYLDAMIKQRTRSLGIHPPFDLTIGGIRLHALLKSDTLGLV